MNNKLTFFSLSILMISSIDNMKNMPAAALFGSPLIFFFLFSAILFLLPTAFASAELSAAFPEKGGVYHWVGRAFGERFGMIAVWLQWINTMVWYPTMLSFIAGTLAYLIDPVLAENKFYLISCVLTLFWGLTWINLKGLQASSKFTNICSIIGTIIPMSALIVLGAIWVIKGKPIQISFHANKMIPSFSNSENWVSLIAIMASFLGMELSGVHISDIHNPQKNFPRAILCTALFIFFSMGLSSLAIAIVLPKEEIQLISGVIQVFRNFFMTFGLNSLTPIFVICIAMGSLGTMVNWLISPAKGLFHAAESGFISSIFVQKNKAGVASRILLMQAILVSLFCLVLLLIPNVNGFFWFLTSLSTELYMLMYILMFSACIKLHYTFTDRNTVYKISGKWIWIFTICGLAGSGLTIVVSFIPPTNIDIGSPWRYFTMIGMGNLLALSPLYWFYRKKKEVPNLVG